MSKFLELDPSLPRQGIRAGRESVPADLVRECLARDTNCVKCGSAAGLSVHHIQHAMNGGENALANLVVLCEGCHNEWHFQIGAAVVPAIQRDLFEKWRRLPTVLTLLLCYEQLSEDMLRDLHALAAATVAFHQSVQPPVQHPQRKRRPAVTAEEYVVIYRACQSGEKLTYIARDFNRDFRTVKGIAQGTLYRQYAHLRCSGP